MNQQSSTWILVNGLFRTISDPVARIDSRGLMYGDGCFETLMFTGSGIAGLDQHLARLKKSIKYLGMREPEITDKHKFISEFRLLLQKNKYGRNPARIRLQLWREQGMGYPVKGDEKTAWAMQINPPGDVQSIARLGLSEVRRIPANAINPAVKLSNGINYIIAANEAKNRKWDDAVMLDQKGNVSETTCANLFWEKNGEWFTPAISCDILPGITRGFVIQWLKSKKVKISEGEFRPDELKNSDALYVCNSVKKLLPVRQFEDKMYLSSSSHSRSFSGWLSQFEEDV